MPSHVCAWPRAVRGSMAGRSPPGSRRWGHDAVSERNTRPAQDQLAMAFKRREDWSGATRIKFAAIVMANSDGCRTEWAGALLAGQYRHASERPTVPW